MFNKIEKICNRESKTVTIGSKMKYFHLLFSIVKTEQGNLKYNNMKLHKIQGNISEFMTKIVIKTQTSNVSD